MSSARRKGCALIITIVACGIAGAAYGLLSSGTFIDAIAASLVGIIGE
jgi:hypothetical protein